MSDVLEQMKTRRSVKKYKPDMVPQEIIDKVTEAGLYAANGMGRQATIILQITNKEMRDKLSELNRQIGGWKEEFASILWCACRFSCSWKKRLPDPCL